MSYNLEELVGNSLPTCGAVQETLTVPVDIKILKLNDISELYVNNIEAIEKKVMDQRFRDEFTRYLYTTFVVRMYSVTGDVKNMRSYPMWRSIKVPTFWAALLGMIGTATDINTNIIIIPSVVVDLSMLMSGDELMKFNVYLRSFIRSLGLVDFPVEQKGDVSFMSKIVLENEIRGYRREDHPIYALLSSIISKETVETAFQNMCRLSYGTLENAWYHVTDVVIKHGTPTQS